MVLIHRSVVFGVDLHFHKVSPPNSTVFPFDSTIFWPFFRPVGRTDRAIRDRSGTTAQSTSGTTARPVLPLRAPAVLPLDQYYRSTSTTVHIRAVLPPRLRAVLAFSTVLTSVLTPFPLAIDIFEFGFGFECLASSRVLPLRHDFIDIDDGTPDPKRFFDYPQVARSSPPNITKV